MGFLQRILLIFPIDMRVVVNVCSPASYRDAKNGGLWRAGRSFDAEIAMDLRVWTADSFALQEKNKIFWKGIDKSARLW